MFNFSFTYIFKRRITYVRYLFHWESFLHIKCSKQVHEFFPPACLSTFGRFDTCFVLVGGRVNSWWSGCKLAQTPLLPCSNELCNEITFYMLILLHKHFWKKCNIINCNAWKYKLSVDMVKDIARQTISYLTNFDLLFLRKGNHTLYIILKEKLMIEKGTNAAWQS